MEKKTLSSIIEGKIFQIPDYQRGYAWENKQWKDFVQDIDALIDDKIIGHYTGTIVIYQPNNKPTKNYGIEKLEIVDVVDGQQRLTTCSLYLSIILRRLIQLGENEYQTKLTMLYSDSNSRLILNNDTDGFYYDIISKGVSNIDPNSVHQERIFDAYKYLNKYIEEQFKARKENGKAYLKDLFDAITRKLNFSFYIIEVESEIGMTFELMNSRGKDLSSMELLKNYLMYWVYRNVDTNEKEDLTKMINKSWKEVYVNIAKCNGNTKNEEQCLRIAWTLYVNCSPKSWEGYSGFKNENVIPLRDFSKKNKEETNQFIIKFIDGLALISKHYSAIIKPDIIDKKEFNLLSKIINAGNIASYISLLVAVRIKREEKIIDDNDYYDLLKALEVFSYRVFLWSGKRSNAGLSQFYRWADEIFYSKKSLKDIIGKIYDSINWYSNENNFRKDLDDFNEWYHYKRLLKYTLFEYELFLLNNKNNPKIKWEDLSDATIEHILPQTPEKKSEWLKKWTKNDIKQYLHDISNLVLTKDNSRYLNFEFERKKGNADSEYCYLKSDINQERKIAEFTDWTPKECQERREALVQWIIKNWGIDKHFETIEIIDDDEESILADNG